MATSFPIKVNDKIILNHQLSDGVLSLPRVVKAIIRNESGSLLNVIELSHVGDGLFKDLSMNMPDTQQVTAQFFVYDTDGLTIDDSYYIDMDTYYKVEENENCPVVPQPSNNYSCEMIVDVEPQKEIEIIFEEETL